MKSRRWRNAGARCGFSAAAIVLSGWPAAAETASAWTADRPETKSRLVAGVVAGTPLAAVEITLAEGWKTYWRFPGDAGGVPPGFDWAKSENVVSVKVLYPAPKRMTDESGITLGYKGGVVFPVEVVAKDAAKPVNLKLSLDYGICKEICIPVQAELALEVPAGLTGAAPASVVAALDHVPRAEAARRDGDPKLIKTEVMLDVARPSIAVEAEFPGGADKAEAYVFSPSGVYIPMPKAATDLGGNRKRFEIDLTAAADPADLKGKTAVVTLVSEHGLSEATFKLE